METIKNKTTERICIKDLTVSVSLLNCASSYKDKKVLLLQGPRGHFFWRLKKDLESFGAIVYKINFNGGDFVFYPINCINYRGKRDEWHRFFEEFIKRHKIDIVLFFGDFRYHHKVAREICCKNNILAGCFEEGYIRPDFVTLDFYGVNGYSKLAKKDLDFQSWESPSWLIPVRKKVGNTFYHECFYAIGYYIFANLLFPVFPHYRHHISLYVPGCLYKEAFPWLRSGIRKIFYNFKEKRLKNFVYENLKRKYFLAPLQVFNDSQVVIHSPFKAVENFIEYVITSFAKNSKYRYLIFKHHPRARGYVDYGKVIKKISKESGVEDRVLYIHDAHLPTLIKNSVGVIVINSSVGMQALDYGKPVKTLGKAIYDKPKITYTGSLDDFWNGAEKFEMDINLYKKLENFILFHAQLNGSLHKRVNRESFTGLNFNNIDEKKLFELNHKDTVT